MAIMHRSLNCCLFARLSNTSISSPMVACIQRELLTHSALACEHEFCAQLQATIIGSSVFIFGGEDSSRRPLGELVILDLAAMAWVRPDTTGLPPAARSAHTAVAYKVGLSDIRNPLW